MSKLFIKYSMFYGGIAELPYLREFWSRVSSNIPPNFSVNGKPVICMLLVDNFPIGTRDLWAFRLITRRFSLFNGGDLFKKINVSEFFNMNVDSSWPHHNDTIFVSPPDYRYNILFVKCPANRVPEHALRNIPSDSRLGQSLAENNIPVATPVPVGNHILTAVAVAAFDDGLVVQGQGGWGGNTPVPIYDPAEGYEALMAEMEEEAGL